MAQSAIASKGHNLFPLSFPLRCRRKNVLGKNWLHWGVYHITHDKHPIGKAYQEFLSQSRCLDFIHYYSSLDWNNGPTCALFIQGAVEIEFLLEKCLMLSGAPDSIQFSQ
jgi:hypothetical protein